MNKDEPGQWHKQMQPNKLVECMLFSGRYTECGAHDSSSHPALRRGRPDTFHRQERNPPVQLTRESRWQVVVTVLRRIHLYSTIFHLPFSITQQPPFNKTILKETEIVRFSSDSLKYIVLYEKSSHRATEISAGNYRQQKQKNSAIQNCFALVNVTMNFLV